MQKTILQVVFKKNEKNKRGVELLSGRDYLYRGLLNMYNKT